MRFGPAWQASWPGPGWRLQMRIDGAFGIDPHRPSAPAGKNSSATPRAREGEDSVEMQADPEIRRKCRALIEQARAAKQGRDQVVAEARELLAAGKLDQAEAIRRAAENLLDLGP